MIRITYEFATEDEALRFLARDKAQPASVPPTPKVATKAVSPTSEAPRASAVEAPRASRSAETAPAPVKAASKAPNAPVQAVAELNEAAVRTALRDVVNTKGMKAAAEILKNFSASSISQVKPAQYDAFVKACGK